MRGIYNKPWLDLDPLLPLHLLDVEEMELGMCQVPRIMNVFGKYNPRDFLYFTDPPIGSSDRVKDFYAKAPAQDVQFFTKLAYGVFSPGISIKLSYCDRYHPIMVDDPAQWRQAHHELFPSVFRFIKESGVFSSTGRINFFVHDHYCPIPVHTDYWHKDANPEVGYHAAHEKEFLWLNPRMLKSLYVLDDETKERHVITSKSAWFNSLDLHGGDAVDVMTWTLRIDGKFSPEFKLKVAELHGL